MTLLDKLNVFSNCYIQHLETRTVIFETRRLPREKVSENFGGSARILSSLCLLDYKQICKQQSWGRYNFMFASSADLIVSAPWLNFTPQLAQAEMVRYLGRTRYVHIKKLSCHRNDSLLRSFFLTSLVFCEIHCVLLLCCIMDLGIWDKAFLFFPSVTSQNAAAAVCQVVQVLIRVLPQAPFAISGNAVLGQWSYIAFGTGTVQPSWKCVVLICYLCSVGKNWPVLKAFFSANAQLQVLSQP